MSIINPTNPHSYYKADRTANLNDCGYEITYTIEGDTIFTKRFYNNGTETTCQVIIDKLGNVKTTSNTQIPNLITKQMNYELKTTASNGSQSLTLDNFNPTDTTGFNLQQTKTFNTAFSGTPTSYHNYFTKTESDDYFISEGFITATFPVLTLLAFIESLVGAYMFFKKMKDKLPFKSDNIVFIQGDIKESADTNKLSVRQSKNIIYVDGLLRTGKGGFKGYDKEQN
ncbi:MAG TPA: hypothetical protein V6C58_10880 [Allocoleopsis sp.]